MIVLWAVLGGLWRTVWYWIANHLPDRIQPTRIAEFTAGFLYHLVVFWLVLS